MKRIAISVVLGIFAGLMMSTVASAQACPASTVTITSNFNGTPIPAGSFVWFNSHLNASAPSQPTIINVTNVTLNIAGTPYSVPNASIIYDSAGGGPSTTFDAATNTWITHIPGSNGDAFMTGFPIQFPMGLAGGQNPVTLTATFTSNNPGASGSFQWGAAVYTQMSSDLNALGVLPTNMGGREVGTPVNFEHFVIGGARGGGGSNFTGSWSATGHFTPCTMTPTPTPTPTVTPTTTPTPPMTATPTPPTTVPEPGTIVLFGTGLVGLGGAAFRRFFGKKKGSTDESEETSDN